MRHASSLLLLALSLGACSLRIPSKPACGDGDMHTGETCDDGNTLDGDGCSAQCAPEEPICGNNATEEGEQCDDGNTLDGDGCSSFCREELASCGDGILDAGEQCDDDNLLNADGCEADCTLPACSNGIVDPGEVCFDAAPLTLTGATFPRGIDIEDLNQDGRPDIIVSEQGLPGPGGVVSDGIDDGVLSFVQINDGFAPPNKLLVGGASRFVRALDTSGDGLPEILVTHEASDTLTQLTNEAGVFTFDSSFDVPNPSEFALGDIDGDSVPDAAVASFAGGVEIIFSSQPVVLSLDTGCPTEGVDLGDLNNDGTLDVLAVCGQSTLVDQVKLFSGEDLLALGAAAAPFEILSVDISRVGRIADFDGDDLLDLAIVERTGNSVAFFFQGARGFTKSAVPVGAGIISFAIADMNRDGFQDLVTVEEVDNQSTILLSNGDQTFTALVRPVGVGPRVVAVGDLNEDTLPDFAAANRDDNTISVYLSTP